MKEAVAQRCSAELLFRNVLRNWQKKKKTCPRVSFNNFAPFKPVIFLIRGSCRGLSPRFLGKFSEQLLYRAPVNGCFWYKLKSHKVYQNRGGKEIYVERCFSRKILPIWRNLDNFTSVHLLRYSWKANMFRLCKISVCGLDFPANIYLF